MSTGRWLMVALIASCMSYVLALAHNSYVVEIESASWFYQGWWFVVRAIFAGLFITASVNAARSLMRSG